MGVIRVHQVLATLGYGDAIGHEVLGIQRVLRAAGYDSEIFVETADRRLEPLPTDSRENVGAIAPEYFRGVHKALVKLCYRGRRELTAYIARCELALGDSEYNRQELAALGFAH